MPRRTHYDSDSIQLSVVVQRRIAATLEAIARRDDVSRSEIVRRAVRDALAREERGQDRRQQWAS